MIVQELVTLLGFDVEDKKLKEFNKGLSKATKNATVLVGAIAAAGTALFAFVRTSANSADEIIRLSAATGMTVEELQRLKHAAEINKTSMSSLQTGLSRMTRLIGDALVDSTSTAANMFEELNIQVRNTDGSARTSHQVFLDLADSIKSIEEPARRAAIAQEFMGRSGAQSVALLQQGSMELKRLGDELEGIGGIVTREQMENLEVFNDTVTKAISIVRGLKNVMASELAPELTDVVQSFINFVQANRDLIKDNILGVFRALSWWFSLGARALGYLTGAMFHLIDSLGGAERWAKALLLVFTIITGAGVLKGFLTLIKVIRKLGFTFLLTWAKAMAPVTIIVAALAGLFLLIEDIILTLKGAQNTITGPFLNAINKALDWIYGKFLRLEEIIANLFSRFKLPQGLSNFISRAQSFTGFGGNSATGVTPSNSPISNTNNANTNNVRVEAPITVNVPAGTNPGMVGEKIESGVAGGVEKILRQTGRNTLPSGGY